MNKYDWKNAFPKPSENFHNKLCMTLDSFEKENVKMKKYLLKEYHYCGGSIGYRHGGICVKRCG